MLASLDFEGLTGAYTLAISDYFLSSATVTVEQMGTLKAFSTLVLEANEKQVRGLFPFLSLLRGIIIQRVYLSVVYFFGLFFVFAIPSYVCVFCLLSCARFSAV